MKNFVSFYIYSYIDTKVSIECYLVVVLESWKVRKIRVVEKYVHVCVCIYCIEGRKGVVDVWKTKR